MKLSSHLKAIVAVVLLLGLVGCSKAKKIGVAFGSRRRFLPYSSEQRQEADERRRRRRLLFPRIWNYSPQTKVTDIAGIDLDFKSIQESLRSDKTPDDNFKRGENIYKDGGHVGTAAVLHLEEPLDREIPAGTTAVIPTGISDSMGWGKLVDDVQMGDEILLVEYATGIDQSDFLRCQIGSLPTADIQTSGCFVESGVLNFPDLDGNNNYEYSYNKMTENINTRTLISLSLNPQNFEDNPTFVKYKDYYGSPLYMDEIITAAFNGRSMATTSQGSMDFSVFGDSGNTEVVEMSITFLTIWMTVVCSMEQAIKKCNIGTCDTEICKR